MGPAERRRRRDGGNDEVTAAVSTTADLAALERQVSGSSFYAAMRLLPKPERAGMFAIYAFCRQVDDIADDGTLTVTLRDAQGTVLYTRELSPER